MLGKDKKKKPTFKESLFGEINKEKPERFTLEKYQKEPTNEQAMIVTDTETGIQYLAYVASVGVGLTALLDESGQVSRSPNYPR